MRSLEDLRTNLASDVEFLIREYGAVRNELQELLKELEALSNEMEVTLTLEALWDVVEARARIRTWVERLQGLVESSSVKIS